MHLLVARLVSCSASRSTATPLARASGRGFVATARIRKVVAGALIGPMFLIMGGVQGEAFAEGTAGASSNAGGSSVGRRSTRAVLPQRPALRRSATHVALAVEAEAVHGTAAVKPTRRPTTAGSSMVPSQPSHKHMAGSPAAETTEAGGRKNRAASSKDGASPKVRSASMRPPLVGTGGSAHPARGATRNPGTGTEPASSPVGAAVVPWVPLLAGSASITGGSSTAAEASGGKLVSLDRLVAALGGLSPWSGVATGTVQPAAVPALLGSGGDFAILGSSTITNTGLTTVAGDVGLSPGSAVTGFAPCAPPAPANCVALAGELHVADGAALQAQMDQLTAYNSLVGMGSSCTHVDVELAGRTFLPGTYCSPGTLNLSAGGIVTLDAQGNVDAQFIFLTGSGGSTLITGAGSQVLVTGGAQACNVYWQVASSATIGVNTAFTGHILAAQSIQLQTGASLQGSVFAHNGAVTLDTNTITRAGCRAGPVVPPGGGTPGGGTPGGGTPGGGTPGGGTPGGGTPGGGTPGGEWAGGGTTGKGSTGAGADVLGTTGLVTAGAGVPSMMASGASTGGGRPGRPDLAVTGATAEWELLLAGTAIGLGGLMRAVSRPRRRPLR